LSVLASNLYDLGDVAEEIGQATEDISNG